MPPTLDLSRSKMIVSPPRINLRRATSYTGHDKGPLSSTSSRFSFNHLLLSSPPPSPGLPQLVPRPRKPSHTPRPSRVFRALLWMTGIVSLVYLAVSSVRRPELSPLFQWPQQVKGDYEMVARDTLPDFPTPVIVTDRGGNAKWTIYIPPSHGFPLPVREYSAICSKCREVASKVEALQSSLQSAGPFHLGHSSARKHFVDVAEAETAGVLPGTVSVSALLSQQEQSGGLVGANQDGLLDQPVCSMSLTFVLESEDAGLGQTVMMLWIAYAIAKREGRAFFIDDTRWAYGRYVDIFEAPPHPGCRPPLRHEIVPCPRHARHLVVSSATTKGFVESIPPETSDRALRSKHFQLARTGFEDLFLLNREDADYVSTRVKDLKGQTRAEARGAPDGVIVGLHVRRGDRHPFDFQYRGSYIPPSMYTERALTSVNAALNSGREVDELAKTNSVFIIASDDPTVYEIDEFKGAARAQERIRLAGKVNVEAGNPDRRVMHKFVDEAFGWEGGFFAAMFWNLGLSTLTAANAPKAAEARSKPSAETVRLRSLVGRAYMMDLAVLSQASDSVVCTVSAMGCRLLAVMLGQERAFDQQRWINIDGEYGWSILPIS
ncbi:uncharacterized protein E0L32_000678 [Thyridium curvatum]|uniref:Fucosyltransferase n=1 Tax=Thyridium curvatum TaxID=1093900 RepID=A0A507B6E2_9PEZI|nr:uncharacterized protein E0L32_000678 [Thyridium curvatum]TPX14284.1 hypothetical protein E0L32_000678 [Thyridium curvatum]